MRTAIALLALLVFSGSALAQLCEAELETATIGITTDRKVATALARRVVELIEPALPAQRPPRTGDLEDPNAAWLQARGFLPDGWHEGGDLTTAQWQELLSKLQQPYRTQPYLPSGGLTQSSMTSDAGEVLTRIASTVRPLALVATDASKANSFALVTVVWNWTPWPRLLVFDPATLARMDSSDLATALAALGTCAWRPTAYFHTDLHQAIDYYLGAAGGGLRVLEPVTEEAVISGLRAIEFLTFASKFPDGTKVASLAFEGAGPSFWQVLGFLSSAESNVSAFELPYYLAFP